MVKILSADVSRKSFEVWGQEQRQGVGNKHDKFRIGRRAES